MHRTLLAVIIVLSLPLGADETASLLARAWPAAPYAPLAEVGAGVGIVFSPDLSVKDNCRFYETLGFACFESADWMEIVTAIQRFNIEHPGRRVRTLLVETHGTNGHGLKVQTGKKRDDPRSYIAVAALQEMLEPVGVRHIILSACNSGRLLRPEIYRRLNRDPGDKLFLPATLGIVDATDDFDPQRSRVTVITPATSTIETTLVGSLRELAPRTREALQAAAESRRIVLPRQFAISEMLINMLLRSPSLRLRTGEHVEELSRIQTSPEASEKIFHSFVAHLDALAGGAASTQTAAASGAR